jgi:hypothetical protein
MQGSSSFLTVKQVATALGIDERSVRDKLTVGTLKGTKKTVGNKDQWFVHQRDLDAELARRGITQTHQQRSVADNAGTFWTQEASFQQTFDTNTSFQPVQAAVANPVNQQPPSAVATVLAQPPEVTSASENITQVVYDEDVTDIVAEVQEPPETDKTTSGGERHNWLNEDMQRQLQATAEVFMRPLVARIEALTAADIEKDAVIRAKDLELEEAKEQLRLLPDFEAQRAKLLNDIEAERKASEIQFAKAKEREEEAKVLTEENERLKQKAEEAILSAAKLEELEKVVQELQKPKPGFWKKFFGTQ